MHREIKQRTVVRSFSKPLQKVEHKNGRNYFKSKSVHHLMTFDRIDGKKRKKKNMEGTLVKKKKKCRQNFFLLFSLIFSHCFEVNFDM